MAQTFGVLEWGSLDWGSQDGPVVHDISPMFTTASGLDALLRRFREVVQKKDNEWGKPEWSNLTWGGRGDVITFRTGQGLKADLGRYRSASAAFTTISALDSEIIKIKSTSADFLTSSELEVLIRGAARGVLNYQGSFAPGETIEMNNVDLLLTKGGVNDRKNANIEDWVDLEPGKNILVYTDSETGRDIQIEIIKEDRTI